MYDNGIVLRTRNLSKRFDAVTALENFTVDVKYGEWISIMGPSGSGKTTLLNLLACLDPPTDGEYFLDGIDTAKVTEKERAVIRREKIGLIFQQFHLVPYLTALENVMLAQYYHSMICEQDCLDALERVGLAHRLNHLPSQLSGGEQQRVCIARALINEPAIILADEPTGNLDEENEQVVLNLFEELHAEGRTIVLVTHNPSLGEEAERMVTLQHGKIKDIKAREARIGNAHCL